MSQDQIRGWLGRGGAALAAASLLFAATTASAAIPVPSTAARLTWRAARGPVAGYNVQVSKNGSAWTQFIRVYQPSVAVAFPKGINVRVRVAAFDSKGNTGPWSAASTAFTFTTASGGGSGTSAGGSTSVSRPAVARLDLNGDGYDDILWQNTADGSYHAWFMRGARRTGQKTLSRPSDPAAHIAGVADFDGDGRNDLLYFDSFSGAMWVATRGGVSGKLVRMPSAPAGWDVAAVGQFDGYAGADILLRNMSSGNDYFWMVNPNLTVEPRALPQVPTAWTVAAALDYDGDGTTDIFWRQPRSGSDVAWKIIAGRVASSQNVGSVAAPWTVAAVGDFDGDGSEDILWRSPSGGSNAIWLWFGGRGVPFRRQRPSWPVDGSWQMAGTVDVDGNGTSDVLWNRMQGGQNVAFLMGGASVKQSDILPTAPSAWEPVATAVTP